MLDDDIVKDLGNVTVVATGGGLTVDPTRLDIRVTEDDAVLTYTLSAPADTNVAEGAGVELTVTASRPVTADTGVAIVRDRASTAGADDYTVTTAAIPAGGTTGTATVTAVDDGVDEPGETLTLYGVVGGVETNAVTLTIWDAAVPALPAAAQLLLAAFLAVGGYRRRLMR